MAETIHLLIYFKFDGTGKVIFRRAYKFIARPRDLTARFSHFIYSHKSEKYHPTMFYPMNWEGTQIEMPTGENLKTIRQELNRIGLDLR